MKPAEEVAREIAEALYDCGRMPLTDGKHREASVAIGVERIMRLVVPWRPIATAPQSEVLHVWVPGDRFARGYCERDAEWSDDLDCWCDPDGEPLDPQPTHWMRELPPPEGT